MKTIAKLFLVFLATRTLAVTNVDYRSVTIGGPLNTQTGGYIRLTDNGNWFKGYYESGTNYGWDDLRFPATAQKVGPDNPPTFEDALGNIKLYSFSGSAMNEIHGVAQFPHTWRTGSLVYAHIHTSNGATTNDASASVWVLEHSWASKYHPFPALIVTNRTTNLWPIGTNWNHNWWAFPAIDGVGHRESSCMMWRLYRDPGDGADTNSAKEWLLEFDIHYQIGKPSGQLEVH